MRDERDDAVTSRLWSVLEPSGTGVSYGRPAFADRGPLTWSDVVPSWAEDVDPAGDGAGRPVVTGSSGAPIDPPARAVRPAWSGRAPSGGPGVRPLAGAFGGDRPRLAAFDPGRRGVRALAAVVVVVVLTAAFLAWRARPRVEPVPPPPVAAQRDFGTLANESSASASASAQVVVAVEGKVGKPGVVRLPAGSRVADALAAAGGARSGVDVSLLNLARKVVDGELILVGVTPPPGTTVAAGPPAAPGGAPAGPVNLNTATVADLDSLPGVGPVLAQRILDARTAQGGFRAVSDLRKVDGIGTSRYEQLKDLVTV